jgi:hypothetical protein
MNLGTAAIIGLASLKVRGWIVLLSCTTWILGSGASQIVFAVPEPDRRKPLMSVTVLTAL